MPISPIFAMRSTNDIDKIVAIGLRCTQKLASTLRFRMNKAFRSSQKFDVTDYMLTNFKPILVNLQLASHLAGYRRFNLTLLQTPSLKRRYEAGILKHKALRLASSDTLNSAIKTIQSRLNLNLDELQAKYDTRAIRILNDVTDDIEHQLNKEFENLVTIGAHVEEAKEKLGAKFEALGITPDNNYTLENIFRTQSQIAFGAGKWQAEHSPEVDEILWGYKYVTVGDDRVRPEHEVLDGITLPKNDPFWLTFYPPNGWSCRCQAIPLFEKTEVKKPPTFNPDNNTLLFPDKGFNFNPGLIFAS